ncbi:hypothetical protein ACP6PL_15055 [Dapis sp. BLCC M126]|uniref:hypothetical protein n=1 Tax=Dapis sp. BLCC M126 TaxID=3400189 RepID=UPI003CEBE6D2
MPNNPQNSKSDSPKDSPSQTLSQENIPSSQENITSSLNQINSLIDHSYQKITNLISDQKNQLDEAFQKETAKILIILERIKKICCSGNFVRQKKHTEIEAMLLNLDVAIQSLQTKEKNTMVKRLRRDAEFNVRRLENPVSAFLINTYKAFLYESSIPIKLLLGLMLALPLYIGIPLVMDPAINSLSNGLKQSQNQTTNSDQGQSQLTLNQKEMLFFAKLCFIAGATGSIISILLRLNDHQGETYEDALIPIFIGLCKPIIGGACGIVMFTAIEGGIIPVSFGYLRDEKPQDRHFMSLFSVAFVFGFSERLAEDIFNQTGDKFIGKTEENSNSRNSKNKENEKVDGKNSPELETKDNVS